MSAGATSRENTSGTPNPYAPPRARVRDIAAPTTSIVLAERSARLGASIVDGLIFSAMVYLPLIVGSVITGAASESDDASAGVFLLLGLGLAFGGFGIWTWLTIRQMSATGQSLAKKYFNIRVVRSDGSDASLGTLIWKRNILNGLISIIPLYGLVEILFIFGEKRQCLHDRLADTIVVVA